MWPHLIIFLPILTLILCANETPIKRSILAPGMTSLGSKIMYGDQELDMLNDVVDFSEKRSEIKKKMDAKNSIKPLPAEDVKCLMSANSYCSKEMGEMKDVLIQAIKEDCMKCSTKEKEEAGMVIAAMLAHDPIAWKFFLTRLTLVTERPKTKTRKPTAQKFKLVGEPEYVEDSKNRYLAPGAKVRVRRYTMEKIV